MRTEKMRALHFHTYLGNVVSRLLASRTYVMPESEYLGTRGNFVFRSPFQGGGVGKLLNLAPVRCRQLQIPDGNGRFFCPATCFATAYALCFEIFDR